MWWSRRLAFKVFHTFVHFRIKTHGWFGIPIHLIWRNQMSWKKTCHGVLEISTMIVLGIFKGICRWIFRLVMDNHCFTWMFNLLSINQKHFTHSHPPTPPKLSHVAPSIGIILLVKGGVMWQQHKVYILGNYGIRNAKRDEWVLGRMML